MSGKHLLDIIATAAGFVFEPTEANPCESDYLRGENAGYALGEDQGYERGFEDGENFTDVTHQLQIELLEQQIQQLSGNSTTLHIDPPSGGEDIDSIQGDYIPPLPMLPADAE